MNNFLYLIAFVLVLMWAIGFIGYHDTWGRGFAIHFLLVVATMALLARLVRRKAA